MCGKAIVPDRDPWALDKFGDALCHPCHIEAVLVFKAKGIDWEGETFGYELGPVQTFGEPADGNSIVPAAASADASRKIGRNELCPGGSGKKFKRCCGQ